MYTLACNGRLRFNTEVRKMQTNTNSNYHVPNTYITVFRSRKVLNRYCFIGDSCGWDSYGFVYPREGIIVEVFGEENMKIDEIVEIEDIDYSEALERSKKCRSNLFLCDTMTETVTNTSTIVYLKGSVILNSVSSSQLK